MALPKHCRTSSRAATTAGSTVPMRCGCTLTATCARGASSWQFQGTFQETETQAFPAACSRAAAEKLELMTRPDTETVHSRRPHLVSLPKALLEAQ